MASFDTMFRAHLAALIIGAAPVSAQLQFDELGKRHLPLERDFTFGAAAGDVDGDGDGDVVLADTVRRGRLYLNDGLGTFTDRSATRLPTAAGASYAVMLVDVDGDHDLDIVFGGNGQNQLYVNDGSGAFTDVTAARMPVDASLTRALAVGDVDGDGDRDIVCANGEFSGGSPQDHLYLNDGTGTFTDVTAARMPVARTDSESVALGDVEGDGDLDLVFGNRQQNRLYLNDGTGTFADATFAQLPFDNEAITAVAFGDVDGDGDADLVLGNRDGVTTRQNRLYLNDGTGTFTDATAARLPPDEDLTHAVTLDDLDGDGDLDLFVGNESSLSRLGWLQPGPNRVYFNDGSGVFVDGSAASLPSGSAPTRGAVVVDFDADGDVDVFVANWSAPSQLLLGDGTGVFVDATAPRLTPDSDGTSAVAVGDVDADGDADLVFGNAGQNRLHINDGAAAFIDVTASRMVAVVDDTQACALGDVDGDGDLDLVSGNRGQNRLDLNDGSGNFVDVTASRMPVDSDATDAVALGDLDGDGDLDMVLGTNGLLVLQNRLYLNDGSGGFLDTTAGRLPTRFDRTRAVALGDVDADGDLDCVFGNWGSGGDNRLYLNDGTATFTDVSAARLPPDTDDTTSVALGDVDGDGDPDLVFGNAGAAGGQNRLYVNDGTGTFTDVTAARMPIARYSTGGVALLDADEDGDADLIFHNTFGLTLRPRLYLNDGAGTFADVTQSRMPPYDDGARGVAVADVDGDGDLDLVFGSYRQHNRVLFNLLRHLDTPFLAVPGRAYSLNVYARYGPLRAGDIAVPILAARTARIPLPPLGTFGLDPSQVAVLPPVIIAQPAGVQPVPLIIPNAPSLIGASVHAQALLAQIPVLSRLTNVTSDVIVP